MVMVGEACEAVVSHGLLRQGGGGSGGDGCDGGVSETAGSSSSLFSSTSSQLTDEEDGDGATSSSPPGRGVSSSSLPSLTSSGLETMQMDGAAGGPLYELSTMLDHLPALRTGLSKYYQGRSQSFTSLVDVSCVEDLAKKIAPYTRRMKASRGYTAALGVKDRLSRTIAKKAPRASPGRLLSRARSTGLLRSNGKPPANQGKREVYRC
ncbi:protein OXIDATIVE STRESS 3-like [Phragmites australis]|uniref:protein OXIDATIVE STRESS 3-like n=1 Tax=Phragmites australis TaxID=29695 RepID=UPI002D79B1DE|nr:protein OXIDATIVE STRESS 3-like [Phragmites australis]